MTPKFSVVLIGRNEEKTLPRLLESLTDFRARGGDVVLVDTGSTDKTAEVARAAGCTVEEVGDRFTHTITKETAIDINERFVVKPEEDIVEGGDRLFDYSAARNYAASLAKNEIIAMPDCDEIYTKLDIDKINAAIEAGVQQFEYNFVYSHDNNGAPVIQFLHCKFYDRRIMCWTGIVHEILTGDAKRQFFGEGVIKLEHFQNPETNRNGYLKGLALDVIQNPGNDRNAHYFGRELMYRGRPLSAIKQLEIHVAMNKWPEERSQSQLHIGECYMMLGQTQKAIHSWVDAFDTCPTRRDALMKIAEYYYRAGSVDHVISYAAAALQIKENSFYGNFQPYYEHMPHEMMYWALWQKQEIRASKTHFDICFAYQPFSSKYLHDFRYYFNLPKVSIVIPTLRDSDALKRTIDSIQALNYPQDKIEVITLFDEPRIGVPKRVKEGVEKATGDWIVYAADDMEFTPDSLMAAFKTAMDNNKFFMAFNTQGERGVSADQGNICEHFMIHKKVIAKIGDVFDTDFYHVGVDNLLWAKMKKINQAMWCPRAVIIHHHFSQTGVMDDVHKIAWKEELVKHDRELLAKKLAELNS